MGIEKRGNMGTAMLGAEAAKAMKERLKDEAQDLKKKGVSPCLAIVRAGAREDDLSYERGAKKRMEMIGIETRSIELPADITQDLLEEEFRKVNEDAAIHGILLLRPLPEGLDEKRLKEMIDPRKDVDCMSEVNMAKVFAGDESGYAPCTAEAVIGLLDSYGISLEGKRAVVIGRSMVVGRPLSMLLVKRNATVTICHTKTVGLEKICREAEILIAAAGKAKMVTADMVGEGAVVVDVGIHVDKSGSLCGDVDYETVEKRASFISPVPRGVGSVTTSVLAKHVLEAARKLNEM